MEKMPRMISLDELLQNKVDWIRKEMMDALFNVRRYPVSFSFVDPNTQDDYEDIMYQESPIHTLKLINNGNEGYSLEAITEFEVEVKKMIMRGSRKQIWEWLEKDIATARLCDCYNAHREALFIDMFRAVPGLSDFI